MYIPSGGTRTLSHGCIIVFSLIALSMQINFFFSWSIIALLFLSSSFSLHLLPSLISNHLNLSSGAQGRSWWLNEAYFLQTRNRTQRDFCAQEPHRVLLGVSSSFHNTSLDWPFFLSCLILSFSHLLPRISSQRPPCSQVLFSVSAWDWQCKS